MKNQKILIVLCILIVLVILFRFMGIEMAEGESREKDSKTDSKTESVSVTIGGKIRKVKKTTSGSILAYTRKCLSGFDVSDPLDPKCNSESVVCEITKKSPQFFSKDKTTALCIGDSIETDFNVSCAPF
jgi:regulatory protein YycI of two-component signal transduction system YycFG